jgi:hypothetical protein
VSATLRALAAATLALALACNGALRFDDDRMEAGIAKDAGSLKEGGTTMDAAIATDAGTPSCDGGNCWTPEACTTPPCPFDCLGAATCSGSCGRGCTATCDGTSNCTLSVMGEGARLSCIDRASCAFQITDDAVVTCQGGATCNVGCAGSCLLNCNSGAICRLRCAGGAFVTVVGSGMCSDVTP